MYSNSFFNPQMRKIMVHRSNWAGLDIILKKRANVVNTDNLRENANINWVEVTQFCGRTTFLKLTCPSLEQIEASQDQAKLSKSSNPKTETSTSSHYEGELWCMCSTGPNMPCTVLFPPIPGIIWLGIFDTGVMFSHPSLTYSLLILQSLYQFSSSPVSLHASQGTIYHALLNCKQIRSNTFPLCTKGNRKISSLTKKKNPKKPG